MSYYPDGVDVNTGGDSGYMKFEEGSNKFRILSQPFVGFEWWVDNKPKRRKAIVKDGRYTVETPIPQEEIQRDTDPRLFNAFIVWNRKTESIEILNITQKKIIKAIINLSRSEDWGDPREYDINVIRTGTTFENTEYDVQAIPPKPLTDEIKNKHKETNIDMDAWFNSENPFESNSGPQKATNTKTEDIDPNDIPF